MSYCSHELPRQIALRQLLNVANPPASGKWSKYIVPKEFVYSKYVCFELLVFQVSGEGGNS